MEKIFIKPKFCQQCNNSLGKIFWVCRTCETHMCHDCFKKHNMNHDYLPCKTLDGKKAVVINVGMGGYGPPMKEWPSLNIDTFFSEHNSRCAHAEDYFNKNNIVFSVKNVELGSVLIV